MRQAIEGIEKLRGSGQFRPTTVDSLRAEYDESVGTCKLAPKTPTLAAAKSPRRNDRAFASEAKLLVKGKPIIRLRNERVITTTSCGVFSVDLDMAEAA